MAECDEYENYAVNTLYSFSVNGNYELCKN